MKKYLGNEIVDDLTANFTTTDYNSYLVSKLSIMGSFKKYFEYIMHIYVCGSPYIILEGTEDDYKSIISKNKEILTLNFSKILFNINLWVVVVEDLQKYLDGL